MTKAELVDQVAATVDLSQSQTEVVLTQCLQAIMDALQGGVVYPNPADNSMSPKTR
jgi:nucleoid DNA-binding protein